MSQYNNINEFNNDLSKKLINLKLNEYFKEIHAKFYYNIEIDFMDYFLELITKKDEICIKHQKLIEFGIIKNTKDSSHIKDCILKFNAKENIDFECFAPEGSGAKQRGGHNKKEYKLTPKLFKLCLIRSIKENKYANYYLILEECYYYYQEYQIMYQNVLLSGKDNKIDNLIKETKKQSAQIEELLGYAKETKQQNEELKETVDDMSEEIKEMNEDINDMSKDINNLNDTMDEIKESFKETADRSVPNPKEEIERHEFILLQSKENNNKFTFLRGIKELNENKIHTKYANYNVIKREFNANPVQLFRQFRDTMKERYDVEKNKIKASNAKNKVELKKQAQKVKISSIRLELMNGYTLNELLDDLTEVCNDKFKDYTKYSESP